MSKSFFSDTTLDILKIESFGSKELTRLHTNLSQFQNYDEKMLVKPGNLHTDQPKKKTLFSCSVREQKISNAKFCGVFSASFHVSSHRPSNFTGVSARNYTAETLTEKLL